VAVATEPMPPPRCTDCGRSVADPVRDLTWFPFTAYVCEECATKRWAKAKEERATGAVCHRCKKPFSLCVC
jgi:DNA-directed RNA polymerase subunit RPC12/RpoP